MQKLLITVVAFAMVALASLGITHAASAQATDPLSVMKAAFDGINAGNLDAVLAAYADNATLTNYAGSFTGQEQLRRALQADAALHPQLEVSNCQVAGDSVTCTVKRSDDRTRGLKIGSVTATTTAIVQGGKIQSLTATNTAESMARIQAAQAALTPRTLPETGASRIPYVPALAASLVLLILGWGIVRRRGLSSAPKA